MNRSTPTIEVNESHGRPRVELRRPSDGGVPPLPQAEQAAPFQDPRTGRITDGKGAALASARARRLRALQEGVATLDPSRCESWLQPFVVRGQQHAAELLQRFPDPALTPLVGATADTYVMYLGLSRLTAGGGKQAGESRQYLREYRACLRELCALSGLVAKTDAGDDDDAFVVKDEGSKEASG